MSRLGAPGPLTRTWLYARGRTERYGTWVIGAGAGRTQAGRAGHLTKLIRDQVSSGSVQRMIGVPYQSRSFAVLEPLLHPGDVLVWEHHDPTTHRRSGGHTQTIQTVARDGRGHITSITLLQGNQPLSPSTPEVPGQTPEIPGQTPEIQDDQRAHHQPVSPESTLRQLPGRRIERGVLANEDLKDIGGVWTWNDRQATTLVAAGPPSGVTRPATRRIHGERQRRVSDWGPSLRAASAATIEGVFEAFLFEVRAGLEGASAQAAEIRREAPDVAAIAGRRLTRLRISAARRQELGTMLVAQARSTGTHLNPGTGTADSDVFTAIGDGVRDAAGITETTAPAEE